MFSESSEKYAPPYEVTVEENVMAAMRDGVKLASDIYRPNAPGRFPAILSRDAYGKKRESASPVACELARAGYVFVAQDIRGRFASDGEFNWLWGEKHREHLDGYDTVEWVASLPYCNGKVGLVGCSYGAFNAWQAASMRPPHLVAMFIGGMSTNPMKHLPMTSGILSTGYILAFGAGVGSDMRRRAEEPKGIKSGPWTRAEVEDLLLKRFIGSYKMLWFLPLIDIPDEEIGPMAPQVKWLMKMKNKDLWKSEEKAREVDVPIYWYTGWDDIVGESTCEAFHTMTRTARSERARRNQRLIIGPWSHGSYDAMRASRVGDKEFPSNAAVNYIDLILRWFDHWLKGTDNGIVKEPPVKVYVMGDNKWRFENEWPPARAEETTYYMHSHGSAQTAYGDGWLDKTPPGDEPTDSYNYDPRDPVLTISTWNIQQYDWRRNDYRKDILYFSTEPLTADLEVAGTPRVILYGASRAKDTDFTARLLDAYPDGSKWYLCLGIVRASRRLSVENPSTITPGKVYQYEIVLNALSSTSNVFKAGHRIVVAISSSDFPLFDRNHNTGALDYWEDPDLAAACQTVYHSSEYPSRIILPVIPSLSRPIGQK